MTSKATTFHSPSVEPELGTIRKVIDDLCHVWDEAAKEPVKSFRVEVDERRAVSIHAHAHHAVRLARALRTLDATGYTNEMVGVIRQIFEDGVTAAWLLVTPGSGDVMIKEGASQRKRAQEHMIRLGQSDKNTAGYLQSNAVLEEMEAVSSSYQLEQRCLALHAGSSLYLSYRALSMATHAGLGISDYYFVESDASEIGVEFDPSPGFPLRTSYLGIAACLLLLAVNSDELARSTPHRTTQLAKAAKRLGVSSTVTRADGSTLPPRN